MIGTGGPVLTVAEAEPVQVINGGGQFGNICLKFAAIFSSKPAGFTSSSLIRPKLINNSSPDREKVVNGRATTKEGGQRRKIVTMAAIGKHF
jgi:hypothetical protein